MNDSVGECSPSAVCSLPQLLFPGLRVEAGWWQHVFVGVCLTVGVCLSESVCLRSSLAMLREASGTPVPVRFLEPGSKKWLHHTVPHGRASMRRPACESKGPEATTCRSFSRWVGRCQIADTGALVHCQGAGGLCGIVFRGPGRARG